MAKRLPELSIFFPFWNEEANIESIIAKAITIAPNVADKWEVVIIDDGSSDRTYELGKKIASRNKNIKIISHQPNRGYGAALKAGFDNSVYDYIVFTDGDGQFDFAEIGKFIEKIEDADMVIGFRKKRRDHKIVKRLLLMNLLKVWDRILFGFGVRDIDCGFKMFRRSAIQQISPLRSEGAMITTEILAKAVRKQLKIEQVGVEHYPRTYGIQTGANLPVIIRAILESLILWSDIHNGRI